MTDLTTQEIDDLADRVLAAVEGGNAADLKKLYAPDAQLWHNFDEVNQTPEENGEALVGLHQLASNLRYVDIRRFPSPGGFVQQAVLLGDGKAGSIRVPLIVRFWVSNGLITRVEEYFDTAQTAVLS